MQRKILLIILVLSVGVLLYLKFFSKKEVHYHAGFKVFVDGKLQDFSKTKYMSIKLCGEDEKKQEENEQLEKAHLHDGVGDVVHVEASDAKWTNLFKNINFKIDKSKPIEGYVNGKNVKNILDYPIKVYDSVVIVIGKNANVEEYLKKSATRKHIEEVEKKSETC